MDEKKTLNSVLLKIVKDLELSGIENTWREARLMAAHVLNQTYVQIFAYPDQEIATQDAETLLHYGKRRCQHEPLAKIFEKKEFWGVTFRTTKDTLDPRPDSETLIEQLLEDHKQRVSPYRILDLGTGTGCLLLSALKEFPKAIGVGIDISAAALDVARENAATLGFEKRTTFLQMDWGEIQKGSMEPFDIILTNPPYIDRECPLEPSVYHDPEGALFADNDGLSAYEVIARQLSFILRDAGRIYVELGVHQKTAVVNIFKKEGFSCLGTREDLNKIERCAIFARQASI